MKTLQSKFKTKVGYSDHTKGSHVSIAASTDLIIQKLNDKEKQNIIKESSEEIGLILKN